jgi:methylated-DNA-[protein]-cysteine S-methyltransferase
MAVEPLQYTVFRTRWGWSALAAANGAVRCTCLPAATREAAREAILASRSLRGERAAFSASLLPALQERIAAYFEGENVVFDAETQVDLSDCSQFDRSALSVCRRIAPGETMTYGQVAEKIGKAVAARAVGGALARNPIPLIVPCHRVVRADGKLGGFSAMGGTETKQRLILHEQALAANV